MKILFIVCGSGFVICALGWYFTWAVYIHSNMSMYGSDSMLPGVIISPEEAGRMKAAQWRARRLRWATLAFLSMTLVAGAALW